MLVKKFAIIGCHIAPKAVKNELEELVKVHDSVTKRWGDDCAVVLMGDFNAAGRYIEIDFHHAIKFFIDIGVLRF